MRSSAGISCPPPHGRNGRTESATENEIRPRKNGRMCKDTYGCGEKERYYAGQPKVNEVSKTFGCFSLDSHASAVAARAGPGSARTAGSRPHQVTVRHAVGAAPLQSPANRGTVQWLACRASGVRRCHAVQHLRTGKAAARCSALVEMSCLHRAAIDLATLSRISYLKIDQ